MASARVDTGVNIYNGAKWTLVPAPLAHAQDENMHELPVYWQQGFIWGTDQGQKRSADPLWAWAMHGPQDPRIVAAGMGKELPHNGVNPNTGNRRLPFGLAENGHEYAKAVPYVHGFVFDVLAEGERLNGGPAYMHFEGGVRIHQVAEAKIWYLKSSYDDAGNVSGDPNLPGWEITGKVIFVQRRVTTETGETVTVSACSSYKDPAGPLSGANLIAGAPSTTTIKWRGSKLLYPKFPERKMMLTEAKFNPDRFPRLRNCINRQGMFAIGHGHCPILKGIQSPGDAVIADDADTYNVGDSLPNADVAAGIQLGHQT